MARLQLTAAGGVPGWLAIDLSPVPGNEEHIIAGIEFSPDEGGGVFHARWSTEGWQIGRVYFETLARGFVRWRSFGVTHFPISYYEDPEEHLPNCTLHLDIGLLHVFLRSLTKQRVAVDVFAQPSDGERYAHLNGICTEDEAGVFGNALLTELTNV